MPASPQQKEKRRTLIGFTLVFLLFGSLLLNVLIGFIADLSERTDCPTTSFQMNTLATAIIQYKSLNRALPTTEQGLSVLVQPPENARFKRKLAEPNGILDPWGHPYRYQSPGLKSGEPFEIWSVGQDGLDGTKDDVRGWSE